MIESRRFVRRRDTGACLAGFASKRLLQAVEAAGLEAADPTVLAYFDEEVRRWVPCDNPESGDRLRAKGVRVESVYLTMTNEPVEQGIEEDDAALE